MHHYDSMPPEARKLLRESRFNLCAACVAELNDNGIDWVDAIKHAEARAEAEL